MFSSQPRIPLLMQRRCFQICIPFILVGLGLWLGSSVFASAPESATAVTCTVDDDVGQAMYTRIISAVNNLACERIEVAAGYYTENITITRSVNIFGAGDTLTQIDGGRKRIFAIQNDAEDITVGFFDLRLYDGYADNGGAVYNEEILYVVDVQMINNGASEYGGAIYNAGNLRVFDSLFNTNSANLGGGLYNHTTGQAYIDNSVFSSNWATYKGGGICNYGTISVHETDISSNAASSTSGPSDGQGSGISTNGPTTIEYSKIYNNDARRSGGGIDISTNGVVTITHSEITTNTAGVAFPDVTSYPVRGGGIMVSSGVSTYGVLMISDSTVRGNNASGVGNDGWGGGIYIDDKARVVMTNTGVTQNTAADSGAGIFGPAGSSTIDLGYISIEIYDSGISNNTGSGIRSGNNGLARALIQNTKIQGNQGSGIETSGYLTLTQSIVGGNSYRGVAAENAYIKGSTIKNNEGGGLSGDNLYILYTTIKGNSTDDTGGGLYCDFARVEIDSSAIHGNSATAQGGGIYASSSTITITNSTVSGNSTDGFGGGINLDSGSDLSISYTTISDNTADNDGDHSGDGGGVFNGSGTASIVNSILAGNIDGSPLAVEQDPDCSGAFSGGWNLIGAYDGTNCTGLDGGTNSKGTVNSPLDPGINALADNGGPTFTHALQSDSLAIDATPNTCPNRDQRGHLKPVDGDDSGGAECDIGAYEYGDCLAAITPTLTITRTGNDILLTWVKKNANREVEIWHGTDPYDLSSFSKVQTNLKLDTTYRDYDALGDSQTHNFYALRAQNACGEYSDISNFAGEFEFDIRPGVGSGDFKRTLISLPLEGDHLPQTADEVAAYIDPNGSIKRVAVWSSQIQGWVVRSVDAPPWVIPRDFAVSPGDVLMILADRNAPNSFAWLGNAPQSGSITYTLSTQSGELISIPLDQNDNFSMDADGLMADISGVGLVATWDPIEQDWDIRTATQGTNFDVYLGHPYAIITNSSPPPSWP